MFKKQDEFFLEEDEFYPWEDDFNSEEDEVYPMEDESDLEYKSMAVVDVPAAFGLASFVGCIISVVCENIESGIYTTIVIFLLFCLFYFLKRKMSKS